MISPKHPCDVVLLEGKFLLAALNDLEQQRAAYHATLSQLHTLIASLPPVSVAERQGVFGARHLGTDDMVVIRTGDGDSLRYPSRKGQLKLDAEKQWNQVTSVARRLASRLATFADGAERTAPGALDLLPVYAVLRFIEESRPLVTQPDPARGIVDRASSCRGVQVLPFQRFPRDADIATASEDSDTLSRLIPPGCDAISEVMAQSTARKRAGSGRAGTEPLSATSSAKVGWEEAARLAEIHLRRNPFPGVNALAKIVGCLPSTMTKAINRRHNLLAAKVAYEESKQEGRSVQAIAISDSISSRTQSSELDPAEAASRRCDLLSPEDKTAVLERLVEQARPSERQGLRQQLDQMDPVNFRKLAAVLGRNAD